MADNWMLKAVLKADSSSMIKSLGDVGKIAKNTRKYLADVASSTGKLGSSLGLPVAALSGVIGGFSLMAVKNAVVGFTDMGEAIQKGALKAGMSVQEYQRMKYVAEQSGTSIEAMEGSLSKLNRQVGEAAAGKNKELSGLMSRLGINVRDANGNIRTGVDLLPKLADAFQRNESPAVRARMGMALFGKSYAEILPLLSEGSKGIEDNIKRFDKIKGVLGEDDIRGAKDLGDSFKDLDLVMKGFQGTIAKELVPVIKPLVDQLTAWWVANKKVVGVEVGKMAKDLAAWVKQIDFTKLLADTGDFFRSLGKLVDMVGGAKNALIGLVIVMNMQTIMAFAGLIGSVWRLTAGLGGLALSALAPVAPLQTLTTGLTGAQLRAATLTNTVGRLGAALGVAGAAFAGWEIGSWLNDNVVNPGVEKLTGQKGQTLGGWIYDKLHPEEVGGNAPSLVGAQSKGRVEGQVNINIAGLPQGSRVEQVAGGGNMPLNLSAGYRYDALGMP